jgi:hypothetical protein
LLSLFFVPALFTIMDDFGRLLWRIFGRFIGKADEPVSDDAATATIVTDGQLAPASGGAGHPH